MSHRLRQLHISAREHLAVLGPAILLLILGFWIAYQFVNPAPPRKLTMATGSPEGMYFAHGQSYQRKLAEHGVDLEILTTEGSVENLKLLEDQDSGVQLALIQGGLGHHAGQTGLLSLGSVYLEPVWCFHRKGVQASTLSDLAGRRIGIGSQGSGTRPLSLKLLALNGIDGSTAVLDDAGGSKAADMLLTGELDAAFFVVSPQAAYIQQMLTSDQVTLFEFTRARAYASHLSFLKPVVLDRGEVDLAADIPARDTTLIAAATQLVVAESIHPALIDLLMQAATEIHSPAGVFEASQEFPSPDNLEYPLSKEARRYYKNGPPFLQRYLPFWLATFVDRMKVMLVPLLVLLIPLFKMLPPVYRWRIRSRIYRWYRDLESVDPKTRPEDLDISVEQALGKLDEVEEQASRTEIPNAYMDELYTLRMHIEMIRKRLREVGETERM